MINKFHRIIFRPQNGWDPVSSEYAEIYDSKINKQVIDNTFEIICDCVGRLNGLNVLDIGGGPGHFSNEFARRGSSVTWYDVSDTYKNIAIQKANNRNLNINFKIGYIDEIPIEFNNKFDLVFNRVCWYYGVSDDQMFKAITLPLKKGGYAYVETNNSNFTKKGFKKSIQKYLNDSLNIKIGHPYPKPGKIADLIDTNYFQIVYNDYSRKDFDRVIFKRIK